MKRINRLAIGLIISTIVISFFLAGWFTVDVIIQDNPMCGFASIDINGSCHSFLLEYIWAVFLSTIYLNVFISPVYIFIIYLNMRRKNNNKRINNEEIIYQRDLPEYNAAMAAYLLDGIIDVKRDYSALLVELTEKNILAKKGDTYEIAGLTKSFLVHRESEKYVLSTLHKKVDKRKFKKAVLKYCQNSGFIMRADIPIIGVLLALLFCNQFYLVILGFIYFKTSLLQELAYKLTSEGGKEKDKMLKLKAFLHNFSKIENVSKLEHNIWDRYLPFAMALDENDNFIEGKL